MCVKGDMEALDIQTTKGKQRILVDSCITPYVKALNDAGLETTGSCCGHGKRGGYIVLKNGKFLTISDIPKQKRL